MNIDGRDFLTCAEKKCDVKYCYHRIGCNCDELGCIVWLPGLDCPKAEEKAVKEAIKTYGEQAQTLMFFEEVSELQKELCKNARGKSNQNEIAEEIADVEIMLEQIKMIHNCGELAEEWKRKKLNRLVEKLRERRCRMQQKAQKGESI